MTDTYLALEEARKAYNDFAETALPADLRNSEDTSFTDLARHIDDPDTRDEFCRLAIAMLNANINHYRSDAVPLKEHPENKVMVVASTLIFAGMIHYVASLATTLIVAGIWYWLVAVNEKRRAEHNAVATLDHNAEVDEWRDTIAEWKAEREELRKHKASTNTESG